MSKLALMAAFMLASAAMLTGSARADEAGEIAQSQPVAVDFQLPPLSVTMTDLDEAGKTCRYDLTGSARLTRSSGGSALSESGSATGATNCNKDVTTSVVVTDSSPNRTTYRSSCQATGSKSSSCSAAQSVTYFSNGTVTRPISTVNFRFRVTTGATERLCVEYTVSMAVGLAATQSIGPCSRAAI